MIIQSAKLVYFSPTHTTKMVLEGIAEGIQASRLEVMDLTPPEARTRVFDEIHGDLTIIGAPVYFGRIPIEANQRLQRLNAHQAPAVVVVVYGNREYEDALLELKEIAEWRGFIPIAGGAFIAENSANYALDHDAPKIAEGRPDATDMKAAMDFGRRIRERLMDVERLDRISPLRVPGNFPYQELDLPPRASPTTVEDLCDMCGECARVCPTGAIQLKDEVITDPDACILCCACVKYCPTGARVCDHTWMKQAGEWLSVHCQERKEPEIYK